MRVLLILFLLCTSSFVRAQSVQVTSGEHEGFSRLVLTFPAAVDWHFGRTETGYALATTGAAPPYNLSDVYRRLGRKRLSAIFADPATGALHLGVSCPCHAIPFEYRPGQVVIDIRDGPAPDGSSFELALEGGLLHPLGPRPLLRPKPRPRTEQTPQGHPPQDWRAAAAQAARMTQHRDLPHIADEADLQSVRSALLWQLSKGATEGLVEIKNPFRKPENQDHPPPRQQIRIGNSIDPAAAERQPGRMREDGSACFSDDDLAIASWGRPGPVSTGIGPVMSGLLGEFDLPDTAAVAQAARYLLYLGFGAETRQLLTGLHIQSAQKPLWDAMAHILDLEPEQNRIFDGMEGCDTAAALWAVLAQPGRTETGRVNIPAVLRNFSALPLHLRKHLGPSLAESFLADGDLATSRAIRDAILRSRDGPQPGVNLLAARLDMASGHTKAGKAELEALSLKPGLEGIDATIALAQIEAADGGEVSADLTTALEAFFHEARGGTSGPGLREVLAVAYASQNRFGQAFALLPSDAASASVLWERLAYYGNDTAIVENAILSENQVVAALPAATVRHLAKRLTELGFSRAALGWLSEKRMKPDAATGDSVLLRAEAALADMDGRQALRELAGSASEKAELLRARALTLLQDNTAAASYAKTDATDEWAVSARQRQSWPEFASLSPDQPWAGALALIGQHSSSTSETARPENLPEGPLARARLALGESAKARTVLQDLLAQTELRPALQ